MPLWPEPFPNEATTFLNAVAGSGTTYFEQVSLLLLFSDAIPNACPSPELITLHDANGDHTATGSNTFTDNTFILTFDEPIAQPTLLTIGDPAAITFDDGVTLVPPLTAVPSGSWPLSTTVIDATHYRVAFDSQQDLAAEPPDPTRFTLWNGIDEVTATGVERESDSTLVYEFTDPPVLPTQARFAGTLAVFFGDGGTLLPPYTTSVE